MINQLVILINVCLLWNLEKDFEQPSLTYYIASLMLITLNCMIIIVCSLLNAHPLSDI
jgi:hypothetical protein